MQLSLALAKFVIGLLMPYKKASGMIWKTARHLGHDTQPEVLVGSLTLIGLSVLLLLLTRAAAATGSIGFKPLLLGFHSGASGLDDRGLSGHLQPRVRPLFRLFLHAEG